MLRGMVLVCAEARACEFPLSLRPGQPSCSCLAWVQIGPPSELPLRPVGTGGARGCRCCQATFFFSMSAPGSRAGRRNKSVSGSNGGRLSSAAVGRLTAAHAARCGAMSALIEHDPARRCRDQVFNKGSGHAERPTISEARQDRCCPVWLACCHAGTRAVVSDPWNLRWCVWVRL